MRKLGFNKVCELEDFADPGLVEVMRDICAYKSAHFSPEYPKGVEHRKDWEVAMAVRSLREFGALRPDATILGVAAGTEDTLFWLTRHVKQVFATDRYLSAGAWDPLAPVSMLVEPHVVAPFEFDDRRLVAQHMDGRALRYPDDTFDGIFSSGSIEHFGAMEDVAAAAYEMGRVLKPGGVLALSTEFRMSGPPGGIGWAGLTLLFSPENLQRYIIDASGLELVDPLRLEVSDATLATPRDLTLALTDHLARAGVPGAIGFAEWDFPHLVLVQGGYVFGSVHLTLRKGERYPAVPNAWARPSAETLTSISEYNRSLLAPPGAAPPPVPPVTAEPAPAPPVPPAVPAPAGGWEAEAADAGRRVESIAEVQQKVDATITGLATAAETVDRQLLEIDRARRAADAALGTILDTQPELGERPLPPGAPDPDVVRTRISGTSADGWACSLVTLPEGLQFRVMVDPSVNDTVAAILATGVSNDQSLIGLMLQLVRPGDLVLDLGAHVGSFSLAACAAGCRAVAVEAWPANVELLRASAARNGFHQLRVVHAAATDAPGTVDFCGGGPWGHLAAGRSDHPAVTVPAVTVDDLLFALGSGAPSFVKIDVEGSEINAIRGMRGLLESPSAPPLLCESNGHTLAFYGATPDQLLAELEGVGYRAYLVEPGRLVRVRVGEMQPGTLVDYLAVKRVPASLDGWRVEPTMHFGERVSRIVADCAHANPHHRAYMARALGDGDPALAAEPEIADALAALRRDPEEAVRAAAAWSAPALRPEPR